MANNRLYIYDTKNKSFGFVAKSFGGGWSMYVEFISNLAKWIGDPERDDAAAWGACDSSPTTLRLVTENELYQDGELRDAFLRHYKLGDYADKEVE